MPNEQREGLDRRNFMMATIGLVGTSATFASSGRIANAQDTKTPPVGPAPGAPQRTVYTGDVIQGKKVISALDVNDLERGKKHAFYFHAEIFTRTLLRSEASLQWVFTSQAYQRPLKPTAGPGAQSPAGIL